MPKISKISSRKKKIKSLDQYAGQWVAFIREKVVASAPALKELVEKVEKSELKEKPAYFLVPRQDEGPYVLFVYEKRI